MACTPRRPVDCRPRVRSRRGLSANTERGYRNDLAGFARRLADSQGLEEPELGEADPWARQNQQLARVDHLIFTDANLALVFGQMVGSGAASASRARMLSALRGFTQWLVTNGHLRVDPTLGFETPQPDKKLPVALTDDQFAAVVTAAASPERQRRSHWAARDVAIVGVLAGCGIRSEELTELRMKDVQRAEPQRIRVLGKGAKERVVPLSPEVLAGIDRYLAERTDRFADGSGPDSNVFVRTDRASLDNRALQRLVATGLLLPGTGSAR